jgi:hypothetical protein
MAQHSIWFELLISWRALASHGCYARAVPGCTMIYLLPVLLARYVPDAGSCCCGRADLCSTSGAPLPASGSFQLHHLLHADDGALFTTYRVVRTRQGIGGLSPR